MRLFLFDVDGTLVTARGAGRAALQHALHEVYGTAGDIDRYDFRGKTDPRIVRDLMGAAGVAPATIDARIEACFAVYLRELDRLIGDGTRVSVMPGVGDLVRALATRTDAMVGLLTGNIEPGARVKLRPTGLVDLFSVGAYGSDSMDRRALPAIARARARALASHDFPFEAVTIIGDTPLDVDCARSCGALAVAVATGQHPKEELAACAPDLLFMDFSDVEATLAALTARR